MCFLSSDRSGTHSEWHSCQLLFVHLLQCWTCWTFEDAFLYNSPLTSDIKKAFFALRTSAQLLFFLIQTTEFVLQSGTFC